MPYVTEYYLDIKLVSGSTPIKKRVVIFDRRTDTKLLTVTSDQISNDGMLFTTSIDKTIPAKQLYAIAFDDTGNLQLAGADKLSIKTRLVWIDKALAYHIEFYPGEPTHERASGTPLIVYNKPLEKEFKQGTLTTFLSIEPTITEYGLLLHREQENALIIDPSVVLGGMGSTISFYDFKSIKAFLLTETNDANSTHQQQFNLSTLGLVTSAARRLFLSGYVRVIGGTRKVKVSITNSSLGVIYSGKIDTTTKTLTHLGFSGSLNPVGVVFVDPRFPNFYCFMVIFEVTANVSLYSLNIALLNNDTDNYTGSTAVSVECWNFSMTKAMSSSLLTLPNLFNATTSVLTITDTYERYKYDETKFSSALSSLCTSTTGSDGNPIFTNGLMLDIIITTRFGLNAFYNENGYHYFCGKLLYLTNLDPGNNWGVTLLKNSKEYSTTQCNLSFKPFDTIRVRAFADLTDNIPSAVKTHYGITKTDFPNTCVVVIYENITQGARVIKKDTFCQLGVTPANLGNICKDSLGRGGYFLQKLQIYSKPLPEDWVLL